MTAAIQIVQPSPEEKERLSKSGVFHHEDQAFSGAGSNKKLLTTLRILQGIAFETIRGRRFSQSF